MKHCILQGMQQCLRKGLGVFAQNASNLVGDSVMTSVRCFGDVNAMQRLSLAKASLHRILDEAEESDQSKKSLRSSLFPSSPNRGVLCPVMIEY